MIDSTDYADYGTGYAALKVVFNPRVLDSGYSGEYPGRVRVYESNRLLLFRSNNILDFRQDRTFRYDPEGKFF